jgi:adhesin transport system outer membrane protein
MPLHAATLTLSDAVEKALQFAPAIEVSSAGSDLSEGRTREALAAMLPAISTRAEYTQSPGYDETITNRGMTTATLNLDYTLLDFGRRMARVRAARFTAESARYGIAVARAQVVFDTTVAYADLIRAKRTTLETGANLDRLSRYVETIERLKLSGRAIENDTLKARSFRDVAKLALSDARNDQQRASEVLGVLIGDLTHNDFDIIDAGELPKMPTGNLRDTPAIRAALRDIESAKMEVVAVQAERYPTFQIALTTGTLGIDPPETFRKHYGASYGGILSMPIFQGGLIKSHIDQANARQMQAAAQARSTELGLLRRLEEARLRYERSRSAIDILARSQPNADDAFALSWTRFLGGGTATLLEVLDAYQLAENLRISRIQQDFAARQAAAEAELMYGVNK